MLRLAIWILALAYPPTPVLSIPSNLHSVLTPFTLQPTVEVLRSPVTKVETINLTPTVRYSSGSAAASAVAVTGPVATSSVSSSSYPFIQRIDSYSSGDSSNAEIRDLLRSLLSELRGSGRSTSSVTTATLSAPLESGGGGYATLAADSYSAPPRNTVRDPNAPTYPDSVSTVRKPEKFVVIREEQQQVPIIAETPVVKEIVRTVYQPVYVPVQYQQPQEVIVQQQVAVPTTVKTGASAVAFSTVHEQPAYAIQQQQAVYPVVQQYQPVQQYQTVQYETAAQPVAYASAYSGYQKKK